MSPLFRADLHVHTCLSPCGDLDMSPRKLTAAAVAAGLDVIAVCDHNTAGNARAVKRAAECRGAPLLVLPGLEICTAEEVHLLALFGTPEEALAVQAAVYEGLPAGVNRPDLFGLQAAVNEDDEVEELVDRLLIAATNIELADAVRLVHQTGGLAFPAHVDRRAYGLYSQLGFWPPDLEVDGFEVSRFCRLDGFLELHPELCGLAVLRGSDAHHPDELGGAWTELRMEKAAWPEVVAALCGTGGRAAAGVSPAVDVGD